MERLVLRLVSWNCERRIQSTDPCPWLNFDSMTHQNINLQTLFDLGEKIEEDGQKAQTDCKEMFDIGSLKCERTICRWQSCFPII